MKISAFTIAKNAEKLYFPFEESVRSILPLIDEYIIAIDEGDEDDNTLEVLKNIHSDKIRIIRRQWEEDKFYKSEILAFETNFALSQCTGDWCFYLQADEVVHEEDLNIIQRACEAALTDERIEGLLFNYIHFWGDYDHYLPYHGWYKNEIRIIRNNSDIVSIKDAQSFRNRYDKKLKVLHTNARVFHYGWVRPPHIMQAKKRVHDGLHIGKSLAERSYADRPTMYDYGPIGRLPAFRGTHPKVMLGRIKQFTWGSLLNYSRKWEPSRPLNKHEKWHYRLLSDVEQSIFGGKEIFGYKNWKLIK